MTSKHKVELKAVVTLFCALCLAWGSWAGAEDRVPIRIKGSSALANAVQEVANMFMEEQPGIMIVVSGGGPTRAFQDLRRKEIEVVVSVRLVKPEEESLLNRAGTVLEKSVVGYDGVAVLTNVANSVLDLTMEQCRDIFAGRLTSWKDVGGPAWPVQVFIQPPTADETASFQELVLKGAPFGRNVNTVVHWKRLYTEIAKNKGAIGLSSARLAYRPGVKARIMGLKDSPKAVAALPSLSGTYGATYPLRQTVYMYWNAASPTATEVKEFVQFCARQGLEIYR